MKTFSCSTLASWQSIHFFESFINFLVTGAPCQGEVDRLYERPPIVKRVRFDTFDLIRQQELSVESRKSTKSRPKLSNIQRRKNNKTTLDKMSAKKILSHRIYGSDTYRSRLAR